MIKSVKSLAASLFKKQERPPVRILLLALVIVGGSTAWGVIHSLRWPIYHDTVIFQYIAWRILHGMVPYREMLDINMPGVYLQHMLALKLFGESDLGFRLYDLSILAGIGAGLLAMCWRTSRLGGMIAALFFASFHLRMGGWHAGQRDFQLCLFLIWGIYAFVRFLEVRAHAWLFFSGVLLGFACWIKPIVALMAMICAGFLLAAPQDKRAPCKAMLVFAAGGVLPALGMVGWLASVGALRDFWEMLTQLLPAYSASKHSVTRWMRPGLGTMRLLIQIVLIVSMILLAARQLGRAIPFWRGCLSCAGLLYGFAHFYLQFKGLIYHFYPLMLFFALWLGLCLPHVRLRPIMHALTLYACIAVSPLKGKSDPMVDMPAYAAEAQQLVDEAYAQVPPAVTASSSPSLMFMDFTSAKLWNVAYRRHWIPASRHVHYFALIPDWQSPYVDQLRREFHDDMIRTKPWVILFPIHPPEWDLAGSAVFDTQSLQPEWRDWFAQHYRLFRENGQYRIYVRTQ